MSDIPAAVTQYDMDLWNEICIQADMALEAIGLGSHDKFVPHQIFAEPDESIALFLGRRWRKKNSNCARTAE